MTAAQGRLPADQQVWIVFAGSPACVVRRLPWLRLFRPEFRHCFAAMRDSCGWLAVDPLCGRLAVLRLAEDPIDDLPAQFAGRGMRVLGPFRPAPPSAQYLPPLAPFTCVTACLRVLGMRAPLVLTPWQLFRHLQTQSRKDIGNNP